MTFCLAFLRSGLVLVAALVYASSIAAATPAARFDEAIRDDLEGKPQLAFSAYLDAAKAGQPEAEFNVAVMLDSGRGVRPDLAQAALWYARAAAHGLDRAAYNLGQLYEAGQGVPRNQQLARAWFEASKLPASRDHLVIRRSKSPNKKLNLSAPVIIYPFSGGDISKNMTDIELIWTSQEEPISARYYVEVYAVDKVGKHEVLSKITNLSSVLFRKNNQSGNYAWRVTALETHSEQYAASRWVGFKVE